jgi:ribonucleoside-diphosphate reductase alpha chain
MKNGFHDVARDYIIYRDKHKEVRTDSPRNIRVTRSDGSHARFNPMKVSSTLEHAFRATYHIVDQTPADVVESVNLLTQAVIEQATIASKSKEGLSTAGIQTLIEEALMRAGHFQVGKELILQAAVAKQPQQPAAARRKSRKKGGKEFAFIRPNGERGAITEHEMLEQIEHACRGLEAVSAADVLESSLLNFYEGIKEHEIATSHIMAAKAKIEKEPAYSQVAARLLLGIVYGEAFGHCDEEEQEAAQRAYFPIYIKEGIEAGRLAPELAEFDLAAIAEALDFKRDDQFRYLGLQTLYDRYFIHENGRRLETPQIFWMRVAMGLSIKEEKKSERAIEFYDLLSQFYYSSATPTLFNSGTTHSQLSSCYLSTVMDDLGHIFKTVSDDAQLSKWAGGLGNDWTNVRATGAHIKGTNGKSQGIIPFLKVANDTAVAVNQGGKRKGAMCAYLETWHLDIFEFLELRKNTGDDRRRTHDMNTANWIPDLFMKRVRENGNWTLFSPNDVPDLHDLYGEAFEKRYVEYEAMADRGEIALFKRIEAMDLWRKMLSMLFETGHPWITFKDPSNIRSPQDHVGVVHSSNLCTEILLNTSKEETAVCNLGSVNLAKHVNAEGLDQERLAQTVRTAIRMLDNVIDINFYPIEEARRANERHRAIGLGLMGFQDALYIQGVSYASPEAVEFADASMEMISYYAILASSELAKERGTYKTYKGSKWDRGYLPIDTVALLEKERGGYLSVDRSERLDWDVVRKHIKQHGMRNCNTMAIAPTATIANIIGVTQSIEPAYKNLYAKSNLSGEFTISNTYLVDALKERGLWNEGMLDDLKYFDGSLAEIESIPDDLKRTFMTAFEIAPEWIIECASRRQKWIDMGESLNLYFADVSGKRLHEMYMLAWEKGLKTTYYLRSLGATQVEKSTTDVNKRGLQPRWMKSKSASANITVTRKAPPLPVSDVDEGCESCQ